MSGAKTVLVSLLVGAHFRPPAKLIIEALRAGTPLVLIPEPENPYDTNAIRVELPAGSIPESQHDQLRAALPSMGFDLDELLASPDRLFLGYVAASGGKPLAQAGLTQGNIEFAKAIGLDWPASARLGFLPDGRATLTLEAKE